MEMRPGIETCCPRCAFEVPTRPGPARVEREPSVSPVMTRCELTAACAVLVALLKRGRRVVG